MSKLFKTGESFRDSLHQRLMSHSKDTGVDIQELMKKVAFDRFLSRIFSGSDSPWILKGGYALELLFDQSRTTKDIDLVLKNHREKSLSENESNLMIKDSLVQSLQNDLNDGFKFIFKGKEHSLDSTPYGGQRYGIECQIGGKRYVSFHIDISVNDISNQPYLKQLEGENWMSFAGISPTKCWALAPEEIYAEKLHAYTLPRERENSRVRDIVDMYLLIEDKAGINDDRLCICIRNVFQRRNTHALPNTLQSPPTRWEDIYPKVAESCGLSQKLDATFERVKKYIDENEILMRSSIS